MFRSLLVANRAEIACRVFRTARAMGLRTVAVYSDADARAKHVREADEAIHIGPAPAADSYLRGDKIIDAAKRAGAEAIHPGYGFLSENPEFAESVIAAGLIWVGPKPASIRAMGLKDEAKRIAIAAGVPVVPGYAGDAQDAKTLQSAAGEIGFPVLIKAIAGGGGRGIREVAGSADFAAALESAKREAAASFGDDRVLVEKLIARPRHIEVQVFGDAHGNLVHLYERDCSLQRRRQKVLEEAPAPGMTDEVRAAMTEAALKVARAVNYENAGTIEYVVDGSGPLRADGFYFLEMNTRLQVEHPVTEAITGLDLVEWQLRVAAGEKLPKTQSEISLSGWAMEARVVAEDAADAFRPSVGRLIECQWPFMAHDGFDESDVGLPYRARADVGFAKGDIVPSAYDSLLGKLIAHAREAEDGLEKDGVRGQCIQALRALLKQTRIYGVKTNAGFLRRLADDADFRVGRVHTGLIADRLDVLSDCAEDRNQAAARLAFSEAAYNDGSANPWDVCDGWRNAAAPQASWRYEEAGEALSVALAYDGGAWRAEVNGAAAALDPDLHPNFLKIGAATIVFVNGEAFAFEPSGAARDHADAASGDEVKAPLPGKIVAVLVKPGESVKKGAALVALEAMKMEHMLKSPRDGVIAETLAALGAQVKEGALLVRLAEAAE
ncbi:MAG: biotin carboxylase N-terminal domain-containing protein [Hyphomonadaceae bacterium]